VKDQALNQLQQELRQAKASPADVASLSALAAQLPRLQQYKHLKNRTAAQRRPRQLTFVGAALVGLAAIVFLIIASQSVLPTSWLYPVQKFSDSVAITVRPSYRATVMMKRSQQVNSLVANHASTDKILTTLADYTDQAKAYKTMPNANYAAFEFCETNLQQADAAAKPAVKQAIQQSLATLSAT
jgi:hypothetical protein